MGKGAFGISLDFVPTVYETLQAEKVLISAYRDSSRYMPNDTAIRNALTAVWIAGRKYQYEKKDKKIVSSLP